MFVSHFANAPISWSVDLMMNKDGPELDIAGEMLEADD
jgi:hypothetical protein